MRSRYEIIIFRSEEDSAFVAEVPELPGCMADGKTYQEALSNAERITNYAKSKATFWRCIRLKCGENMSLYFSRS